jgi:hypothetical protein
LTGKDFRYFIVADKSQLHQRSPQPTPILPLMSHGLLQLIGSNQVFFD